MQNGTIVQAFDDIQSSPLLTESVKRSIKNFVTATGAGYTVMEPIDDVDGSSFKKTKLCHIANFSLGGNIPQRFMSSSANMFSSPFVEMRKFFSRDYEIDQAARKNSIRKFREMEDEVEGPERLDM